MSRTLWRPGTKHGHSQPAEGFRPRLEPLEDRCLPAADAILQWNAVALDVVRHDYDLGHTPDQGGPTAASRALAIVHAALYDAVNSFRRPFTPYLVSLTPQPGASLAAAAAAAGHDTLAALFPQQRPTIDAAFTTALQGIPAGAAAAGVSLGREVAARIL